MERNAGHGEADAQKEAGHPFSVQNTTKQQQDPCGWAAGNGNGTFLKVQTQQVKCFASRYKANLMQNKRYGI